MNRKISLRAAAALSIAALSLSACGGDAGGSGDEGKVTLSFAWWGSDGRHQATQEMIEAFEDQNPNIEIDTEYGDWGGYWDKLATQAAAGDAPDVMQMDLLYIREYAENGVLLDLADIDMSEVPEDLRVSGATDEGVWGVPIGYTALALLANKQMFEGAGMDLPDDQTWTWEDLQEASIAFAEKTDDYGLESLPAPMSLELWLRQHGKEYLTEEGELGWEPADAEAYFETYLEFSENGAVPQASILAEASGALDQTLSATNRAAMAPWWSSQIDAVQKASGNDFEMLRPPSIAGDAAEGELWYKTSMFYSAAAGTEHPEEAKRFIDFMINSEEAAEIGGTERGILANQAMLDHIEDQLSDTEKQAVEYMAEIEPDLGDPVPIPPQGASDFQNLHQRYDLEVLFGRLSPAEAAERMHGEMESALQ